MVIANKMDLEEKLEVSEEEARAFAASIGAACACTSAKTSANVDAAFLMVASKLAEKRRAAAAAAAAAASGSSSSSSANPAAAAAAAARGDAFSLTASPSFAARTRSFCSSCSGQRLQRPAAGDRVELS
ncbi:hypothetical protein, conserved [Eimeria tenella]|uniref:Ras family domain-containing protein n=1 Tax=Eimeria tenella TaxID=5802 RepID=U6L499_EIMTE|nr:hypothetical protein, conserved [Eimeria tenella]CDJ45242.1 hypothetical protein, conserved [Eimeria tenella]|eukprot:XP_013235989.1 hypothetical protein, conserved [Eimeria tenella]